MPRGIKGSGKTRVVKTIDEQIEAIDAQIVSLKTQLADAKSKTKVLNHLKEKADMDAIQKVILESGMTADQLKELIYNRK